MISAKFEIQLPPDIWIAQLSSAFPRATFRLLSGYRVKDSALELGETITDYPNDVAAEMADHPSIAAYELLESNEHRVLAKYETTDTALYDFVELSAQTIEFPIAVQNGWYEFDLTGTREELDRFQEVLESSPLSYELRSLVGTQETDELLTDRQREVLETAIREGYFEIPRECTLSELADSLEIDKSTASNILRRGEARIIKSFVSRPD